MATTFSNQPLQYSFAGSRARQADLILLSRAQARFERGEDIESIRLETGWFAAADGQWRFEIDDHGAKFNLAIAAGANYVYPSSDVF